MSRTHALLVVCACLVAAAWAARRGASARPSDGRPSQLAAIAPLPAHSIMGQADRLRAHLAATAPFKAPTRNPFRFAEAPVSRAASARKGAGAAALATALPEPERPPRPPMSLVGIAEDGGRGETPRRTAIISAMNQLMFVKEGERLLGRYQVVRIVADAVQLKEDDGEAFTLVLR